MGPPKKEMAEESIVPIPPDLAALPIIEAEPWFEVDPGSNGFLEGPAFDREGNLFVTSPPFGIVYKITPEKKLSIIFEKKGVTVDGSAFHRDGRLFIVCISGELLVIDPENNGATFLYPKYKGKSLSMNDLVFDSAGNLYVTDFIGSVMEPTGGIYRLTPDAKTVEPVLLHMASPNGISLSPDGNVLWVGETSRNAIIRISFRRDGRTANPRVNPLPVYYCTGWSGPDSNKVDAAGNLYQCVMGQGRIIIFNAHGIPVANVVIPGRDKGKYLKTSNLAFMPGTSDGYITTSGEGGAWIFKFKGLSKGLPLFSHQ